MLLFAHNAAFSADDQQISGGIVRLTPVSSVCVWSETHSVDKMKPYASDATARPSTSSAGSNQSDGAVLNGFERLNPTNTACFMKARSNSAKPNATEPVAKAILRLGGKNEKAGASIAIDVVPGKVIASGQQEFQISARPGVEAQRVKVQVSAGDGLGITGQNNWTSEAKPGTSVVQTVSLNVTGSGERRLLITATLEFPDSPPQTAVAAFLLNPNTHSQALKILPTNAREKTGTAGETILEIPADTAD